MYVILCSYFFFRFCNPAQCMIFYVHDLVSCPCNPDTMYVILYSRFILPPLQPRHNVWYPRLLI
jgi:hypothetical protein